MAGTTTMDAMIGEVVHQRLWRGRISQAAAARATGMTGTTLSRKLRGERHWTAVEILDITGFLGMSPVRQRVMWAADVAVAWLEAL